MLDLRIWITAAFSAARVSLVCEVDAMQQRRFRSDLQLSQDKRRNDYTAKFWNRSRLLAWATGTLTGQCWGACQSATLLRSGSSGVDGTKL